EENQELALQLAQYLVELNPAQLFVATGPVLSSDQLMQAMRVGVTDYLPKPVAPEELRAATIRCAHKVQKRVGEKQQIAGKIFSFFSPKGGAGATTLATNLAILIHRITQKRTLVVDLDLELGESALVLGVQPRFNFVDFAENFRRMDASLLGSYIEHHPSGVYLLSAPAQPEKAEAVTPEQIRRILTFLRQHFDYIIVDTPGSFAASTLKIIEQADLVFVVSTADIPSLRNIQRGIPVLKRILVKGEEQVRLILNRYDPKDTISVEDVERSIGMKVFWKVSNDYEAVMTSLNAGQPIVLNGGSPYTRDLRGLALQVTGMPDDTTSRSKLAQKLAASFRKLAKRRGGK
ncbi:MAG TPA: AAA family ATPase, partial [Gemmatimonadales bacterium]|nr:AAA family ATPase [Gemmatimonadales bacterium]